MYTCNYLIENFGIQYVLLQTSHDSTASDGATMVHRQWSRVLSPNSDCSLFSRLFMSNSYCTATAAAAATSEASRHWSSCRLHPAFKSVRAAD